jgi:site-specific recombinase XerD
MDTPPAPRLLDRVRDRIRVKHYSIRTEQACVDWIKRFIRFCGKRDPAELGSAEVEAFLTNLAVAGNVAAATQNQATSALLFMYREVLGAELPWLSGVTLAKAPRRLPVVLTRAEVARVLRCLHGTHRLIGCLLYGAGMRIMEGVRLRIKDVEFARRQIIVRDSPARCRLRHPHGVGTARTLGRRNDDDLHARAQSRGPRGGQPAR